MPAKVLFHFDTLVYLLQGLAEDGGEGRLERLAAKFVESEFEKCDRLFEIYFR